LDLSWVKKNQKILVEVLSTFLSKIFELFLMTQSLYLYKNSPLFKYLAVVKMSKYFCFYSYRGVEELGR
jgi:hypothetical protein